MKKLKGWIIAGSVLLIVGVVVWLMGMAILDWNFYDLDGNKYTPYSYELQEGEAVTAIELDFSSSVSVVSGESLKFDYYESNGSKVEITLEGTTLRISEKRPHIGFSFFNFKGLRYKNVLTIPNDIDLTIDGTNTDIKIGGVTLGSLTVDSTNLDLEMTKSEIAGDARLKGTNADISIHDCVVDGDFTLHSTNCDMAVNELIVKSAEIRGTNADIGLYRFTADSLTLHATNLDADIQIVGNKSEYTIETKGKRLPAAQIGTTDKRVSLSGTNCDVELRFVAA